MRVVIDEVALKNNQIRVRLGFDGAIVWAIWKGKNPEMSKSYFVEIGTTSIQTAIALRLDTEQACIESLGNGKTRLSGRILDVWTEAGESGVAMSMSGGVVLVGIGDEQRSLVCVGDDVSMVVDSIELYPTDL